MEGFLCPVCNIALEEIDSLQQHYEENHSKPKNDENEKEKKNSTVSPEEPSNTGMSILTSSDVFRGLFSSGCKKCNPILEKHRDALKESKIRKKNISKNENSIQKIINELNKTKLDTDQIADNCQNLEKKKLSFEDQLSQNILNEEEHRREYAVKYQEEQEKFSQIKEIFEELKETAIMYKNRLKEMNIDVKYNQPNAPKTELPPPQIKPPTIFKLSESEYENIAHILTAKPQLELTRHECSDIDNKMRNFDENLKQYFVQFYKDLRICLELISSQRKSYSETKAQILQKTLLIKEKYSVLTEKVAGATNEATELTRKNAELKSDFETFSRLKSNYEEAFREKTEHETKLSNVIKDHRKISNEIDNMKKQYKEMYEEFRIAAESLKEKTATMTKDNETLFSQNENLSNDCQLLTSKIKKTSLELEDLKFGLEQYRKDMESKIKAIESQQEASLMEFTTLDRENEYLQSKIDEIELDLSRDRKLLKDADIQHLHLAEKCTNIKKENANLEKFLEETSAENASFKQKNQDFLSSLVELTSSNNKLEAELNELKRTHWQDDDFVNECSHCRVPFTFTNRKHHCRGCGYIFCNDCAPKRPNENASTLIRYCNACELKKINYGFQRDYI